MSVASPAAAELTLVGRSSSHFTRVTRIFAAELQLAHAFEVVPDLRLSAASAYADNPALRIPILRTPRGTWFGTHNICRELWRQAAVKPRVIWPEALERALPANAQELVLQAMSTEVTLLMSRLFGAKPSDQQDDEHDVKLRRSLTNTLAWLERHAPDALAELPADRDLSYLEVTLYCLVRHLSFREVLATEAYVNLNEICRAFEARESVQTTAYRVDPPPPPAPHQSHAGSVT